MFMIAQAVYLKILIALITLGVSTCSLSCVTWASSSFSPLAGVADITGIFLAEEGREVEVEDLGVEVVDLVAPAHKLTDAMMQEAQNLVDVNLPVD